MAIFRQPIIGELALKVMRPNFLAVALNTHGFVSKLHRDDYLAYYQLLKGTNEGKSFLRIMRGFELTKAFEHTVTQAAANYHGPRQIIWGVRDHALPVAYYGEHAKEVFRCETLIPLDAKHFLQEDCYVELADAVASQARSLS